MINLVLAATAQFIDTTKVQITGLHRTTTNLGRRGIRVTESWTVKTNGKVATIDFSPYHSRMANTPAFHQDGDQVELNLSENQKATLIAGGKIHLTISAVKN
ncbi:MAG: hypothetical protein ACKVQS_06900 [Fimbriimonadaceae bacterium]